MKEKTIKSYYVEKSTFTLLKVKEIKKKMHLQKETNIFNLIIK